MGESRGVQRRQLLPAAASRTSSVSAAGFRVRRARLFKGDRPRRIDRYIDFFGSAVPILVRITARL